MIILKHVKYKILDLNELDKLWDHLKEATSKIDGVELKDLYFPKGKDEFVLLMKCSCEEKYLEWRDICPPPVGAKDWYEVWLPKEQYFSIANESSKSAIKPDPTARAKSIFQEACNTENMDAKFGRTLSKEENDVRKFILNQSPVLGRIPSFDEIRNAFTQFPSEVVDAILNKLDQVDAIHLDKEKQMIAAAYPFSGSETAHFVSLDREAFQRVNAMCAIDALGAGFMFNCDSLIHSHCHHCSERILIRIQDNEIYSLSPTNVVVWCDMEFCDCAATSLCKNINFFSSEEHFAAWQKENPRRRGELLPIGEAFYLGRLFFENRLES